MNEVASRRCGVAIYAVAAISVLIGVALNVTGSLKIGGFLIGLGVVTALSTAIRLGHMKRW